MRVSVLFLILLCFFSKEFLSPLPTLKLGCHPLSENYDCLFSIMAPTPHFWCNLRKHQAMVTGTHIPWTDEYQHSKLFNVWSCCCCETRTKLNNMVTLGYALFVLRAPAQCRYLSSSKSKQRCVTSWKTWIPSNTTVRASQLVQTLSHKLWKVSAD